MTVVAFATGGHVIGHTTALFILLIWKGRVYSSSFTRALMESSNCAGTENINSFEVPLAHAKS